MFFDGSGDGQLIPVNRWLDEVYDEFLREERALEGTPADRMISRLSEILASYVKQEGFHADYLEKCRWDDGKGYRNYINIENMHNPFLSFQGYWGQERRLNIALSNTKFDPTETVTTFRIHNTDEFLPHSWLEVTVMKLEINEPRI